jgi:Tol biopolymer transport system component
VALVALLVIGCTAAPASDAATSATASASASASSVPSASPSPSPSGEPTDPDGNHVATGLALVAWPDPASPKTELFIVEPDGSLRQVTGLGDGASVGAAAPVWSPDGKRIAFGPSFRASGSFPAVLVVNANGRNQRLIQNLDHEEFSPIEWSADGTQLLYSDATPPGDRRIWLTDLDSGEMERVGTGALPRWLPDGERIVFVDGVEGLVPGEPTALTQVVFVMDIEERQPREFAMADNAHWSPDGEAVLIEADGLLVMAAPDGSGRMEVAEGGLPEWSPDGSRIAYLSGNDQDGRSLVSLMDRSGQEIWSDVVGSGMAWSSDGSRLAVQVDYPVPVVRVLDAETGQQLWETPGAMPDWRP